MGNLRRSIHATLFVWALSTAIAWGVHVANTTGHWPNETPLQGYRLVDAFPNVRFDDPVAVEFPPGETNRLFIVERTGRIMVIPDLALPTKEVFLDLTTSTFSVSPEAGLLGLAFHPGFATNGQFYLYRTLTKVGEAGLAILHDQLSCFKRDPINPNRADPNSEIALLYQADISDFHNAGDVHFGPDGYLYLSIGEDGPPASRAPATPQSLEGDWFGCILRIDVDLRPGNLPPNPLFGATTNYAIPADNPYIGLTEFQGIPVQPKAIRTELFAIGLRNPWRFSFDPLTGDLFAGDVGSALSEEVNFIKAGGNYGWPFSEGDALFPTAPPNFSWTRPAHAYLRGLSPFRGNCIIGGLFYQQGMITNLYGKYICGDCASGNLWAFSRSGDSLTNQVWLTGDNEGLVCFGRDPRDGEILVGLLSSGAIKRLTYTPPALATAIPTQLSDSGIFTTLTNLTVADGIVSYDINLPFWSDGAVKSRWFCVPDTSAVIGFEADGNWSFPTGTFWVKHFEIELTNGVPASRHRLETRVLVRSSDGVYGLTYKWDAAGTNAVLLPPEGADEDLIIDSGGGLIRTQTWHYPTRYECRMCHNATAGYALGFGTAQLNRQVSTDTGETNQIARLSEAGYFSSPVADLSLLRSFGSPTNTAYPLLHRARSYLSVNCVHCHQVNSPVGGPGYVGWDARITTPVKDARLVDGYVIKPRAPEGSRLLQRFTSSSVRMPPLASSFVHAGGYDLLVDWVNSMPQPPWTNLDVGAPLFDGASEEGEGEFAVSSAGSWLAPTNDAFQYLSQRLVGNGQMIALIDSFDGATTGAIAGVMIRNGVGSNSAYAFLGQSEAGLVLTARASNGSTAFTVGDAARLPWLRLVRNQNQVNGYTSADGMAWSLVGSTGVLLPQSATIGMAVTGGNSSKFSNAHFDNVSLLSVNWANLAENVLLNLPATLPLAVDVTAYAATVAKVEFLVDGALIGEAFEEPYVVVWTNATAGAHSLLARAVDASGNVVEAPTRWVTATLPDSTAYFIETEATIHGNWSDRFGSQGYLIAGDMSLLAEPVTVVVSNATTVVWANPASDAATLLKADSEERIAAAWTTDTELALNLCLLDGVRREVALYFLDWTPTNAHALSVDVLDAATGEMLDHQSVTDFTAGKYLVWAVNGSVRFAIRSLDAGNPVVSGVFLDSNSNPKATVSILTPDNDTEMIAPADLVVQVSATNPVFAVSRVELLTNDVVAAVASEPPYNFALTDLSVGEYQLVARATDRLGDVSQTPAVRYLVNYPSSKATFYRSDSLTRGAWIGAYGKSGYVLFGNVTNLTSAVRFSIYPGFVFVNRWLSDLDYALKIPGEPHGYGIQAEWVGAPDFDVELSFPDGLEHLCGFYVSDQGSHSRESAVKISDAVTGEVLDSRILQDFSTGKYYFWQLRGRLKIQFTRALGGTVGLAGMFLDPALPPVELWRGRRFNEIQLGNLSVSSWWADPDQDGISNLAEFGMGLDPWNRDNLAFTFADDHLYLSYTRSAEALDFQFTPEYSTNLQDWLSGPLWVEVVGTNAYQGVPAITVRGVRSINESPAGYLRLRITPP
jgi:glucose/arabinose dehydrogenase